MNLIKLVFASLYLNLAVLFASMAIMPECMAMGFAQPDSSHVTGSDAFFWYYSRDEKGPETVQIDFEFQGSLSADEIKNRIFQNLVPKSNRFQSLVVENGSGLSWLVQENIDLDYHFQVIDSEDEIASWEGSLSLDKPLWKIALVRTVPEKSVIKVLWHHTISDIDAMFEVLHSSIWDPTASVMRTSKLEIYSKEELTHPVIDYLNKAMSVGRELLVPSGRHMGIPQKEVIRIKLPVTGTEMVESATRLHSTKRDLFALLAMMTVQRYHQTYPLEAPRNSDITLVIPYRISTQVNALGNLKAVKIVNTPISVVAEPAFLIDLLNKPLSQTSYELAGRSFFNDSLRHISTSAFGPDYISNFLPLSDETIRFQEVPLTNFIARVPMIPGEKTKFIWSIYGDDVYLNLHLDKSLVVADEMRQSLDSALPEWEKFLKQDW